MGDGTSQLKRKKKLGWVMGYTWNPPLNALFFLASTLWFKMQESRSSQGWALCEFKRLQILPSFLFTKKCKPIKINTHILYGPRQISVTYELAHHQVKGPP